MNEFQNCQQIKYLLASRNWTDQTDQTNPVFPSGSVVITSEQNIEIAMVTLRPPMALIVPAGSVADSAHGGQEPALQHVTTKIRIAQIVPGDALSQGILIGRNRDLTRSENRGLLEIKREVFQAISKLNDADGVHLLFKNSGDAGHQPFNDRGDWIGWIDYTFELICGTEPVYFAATNFLGSGASGNQVSLTWRLPPDRFDRFKMVLRRAAGSTPPSSPTGGTGVALSGNLAESVTDTTTGSGQWSYALFAAYDESRGRPDNTPTTAEFYSGAVTKTVTVP